MFENKEIKRLTFFSTLSFLFGLGMLFIFHNIIYNLYKTNLIENNSYIVGKIVENHPELEEEIIKLLTDKKIETENGRKVLEKYGLDKIDALDFLEDMHTLKFNMFFYDFFFALFYFLCIVSIYFFFIKKQYQKIEEMNKYMVSVLNGDYRFHIRDYEEGAMSRLRSDIYRITTRLKNQKEDVLKDKKNLEDVLSDISHQLKTPLTSMYVINDVLYEDTLKEKEKKELLTKNRKQLERIEWLVSSLLKISRIDSGTVHFKKEEIEIEKLIEKALEPITIALELKNQEVEIKGEKKLKVICDSNWTREAILNILKNAHEHSPEKTKISITYGTNALYTFIKITDEGEGIEEKNLKKVFKRFYKGDHNKESIGIGLNMAYTILSKQNGTIEVESKKGKGTTFTIKLFKNIY